MLINLGFEGVFHYSNTTHQDSRGIFAEIFNLERLKELKMNSVIQLNVVQSEKFVVRGMHWQISPFRQSKLVTVLEGKMLDVFIDLRRDSDTYLKAGFLELNSNSYDSIFLPKGFAHGYQALADKTVVAYCVDNEYSPKHERFLNPQSEFVKSFWYSPILMSSRDSNANLNLGEHN